MQRMLFARVLLQDARLMCSTNPSTPSTQKPRRLLVLVRRWHAEGRTVLAALHDMDLVRANFPETLLLARGPVAWGATARCDGRESRRGAADVRGVRRHGCGLRRARRAVAGRPDLQ